MSRKVPKEMFKANTGYPGQNCQFNISCTSGGPASGCCCTQNALTTFLNMIRLKGSIENDIALRQIVMKAVKGKSWFMFVREILHMYNLPSIFQLLSNLPSKNEWKMVMNTAVNKAVEEGWQQDVKSKSSLKYVNVDSLKVDRTHHIWSTVRNSIYDSRRAQLKSKSLTGTYILQGNRQFLTSLRSIRLADYAQPTRKQDSTSLVNVHFSTTREQHILKSFSKIQSFSQHTLTGH